MYKNILNDNVVTDNYSNANKYWSEKLTADVNEINFIYDYRRSSKNEKHMININFDVELSNKLLKISRSQDSALYVILLSAFKLLLNKYTGQNDITICSPIYNALTEYSDAHIHSKCIPLRDILHEDMTVKQLLANLKQTVIQGYMNQNYPIENLLDFEGLETNSTNLRKVILVLENIHTKESINDSIMSSQNDITLTINRTNTEITGGIIYNSGVFKKETVYKMFEHYLNIVRQVVSNSDLQLGNIELASPEEKVQVLFNFNNTKKEYLQDKTLYELFEEQVDKTPNNIAISMDINIEDIGGIVRAEEKTIISKSLTYKQLDEKANQLAGVLRQKGIKGESIVALMLEPSMEMIVGILGVLKAGGAYLPIDPKSPIERVKFVLNDSNALMLLTTSNLAGKVDYGIETLKIEEEWIYRGCCDRLEKINDPNNLAYIIYTSGTTGTPKGVLIEHKSISDRMQWRRDEYKFEQGDSILLIIPYSFDAFVVNFFTPIISGAKVVLLKEHEVKDVEIMRDRIVNNEITHYSGVPAQYSNLLEVLTEESARSLKVVTLGGEKVTSIIIERTRDINNKLEICNEYGPTEGTVIATILRNAEQNENISIGAPIANTKIYILDNNGHILPVGVPGEIFVGGPYIARGYLNRRELTAEKFVSDPFEAGGMIYKTGDLGRWLPDGNIEFIGRIDHQVKVRGYRIELGEIEEGLLEYEGVKDCIAVAKRNKNDGNSIYAYFIAEKNLDIHEIRKYLLSRLPNYMVPSYFIQLDKMPLTSNGKIDRNALPEFSGNVVTSTEYVGPRNKFEEKLSIIWREVLGVERVSISDNFFELGGDSLSAAKLINRMRSELNIHVSISKLFEMPYILKASEW